MQISREAIEQLLDRLDMVHADDLDSQDLDFKEWDTRSLNQSVRTVVAAAVCMANGGGGTVVFGVADKWVGRDCAIFGVPLEVSRALLIVNATEMRFCAVLQTFSPRNANEMREMLVLQAGLFRRAGIADALPSWRSTVPL